ncbi:type VI secretion protein IcmF/TssM N-terminal domain-containing protein [Lentisphaerota bacterium ZTH]|nr:hypothetical protein JYG24_12615 [Lentisphaerota bacterium]WET05671.1 type VI secretion protein IcmF/TssM N-terminal domain-containing protein [Lentisphaerota bacterium ZTH]
MTKNNKLFAIGAIGGVPANASTAAAAAGGTAVFSRMGQWFKDHSSLLIVIGIIIAAIILAFIAYILIRMLIKRIRTARIAASMREDLLLRRELSRMAAGGGSGERAEQDIQAVRLETIRQDFIEGMKFLRSKGVSFNDMPLYMVVGEPGAGKSEMMRSGGIEYPPGLVDMTQGCAGTQTMHWWTTADGIVLDVGGKVFFNRWGGKSDMEWQRLLRLIKKYRSVQPISGIVLTIPADALLLDPPELVNRKVNLITDELRALNNFLGIRCPVYFVITKADLISGFSEFFSYTPEQDSEGMFGWSNPDSESQYEREKVNAGIEECRKSLLETRSYMMLDNKIWNAAAHGENRADIVAPIYSLPNRFDDIKERLFNYLDGVFSPIHLKGAPNLMLRGVYFTAALDKPNISMPQETVEESEEAMRSKVPETYSERHYFIRRLFMEKIFQESSLTQYTSAAKRRMRRPFYITAAVFAVVALLIILQTFRSYSTLKKQAKNAQPPWRTTLQLLQQDGIKESPIIEVNEKGDLELKLYTPMAVDSNFTRLEFFKYVWNSRKVDISIPLFYRFAEVWDGDFSGDLYKHKRKFVFQIVFSEMCLAPFINASRFDFWRNRITTWNPDDTQTLLTLAKIEKAGAYYIKSGKLDSEYITYEPIFSQNVPKYKSLVIQNIFMREFPQAVSPKSAPALFLLLSPYSTFSQQSVLRGLQAYNNHFDKLELYPDMPFHKALEMVQDLQTITQVQEELNIINNDIGAALKVGNQDIIKKLLDKWIKKCDYLIETADRLDAIDTYFSDESTKSLKMLFEKHASDYMAVVKDDIKELKATLAPQYDESAFYKNMAIELGESDKVYGFVQQKIDNMRKIAAGPLAKLWEKDKNSNIRNYAKKIMLLRHTYDVVKTPAPVKDLLTIKQRIESFSRSEKQLSQDLANRKKSPQKYSSINACSNVIEIAKTFNISILIKSALALMPKSSTEMENTVAAFSKKLSPLKCPPIVCTNMSKGTFFEDRFNPQTVKLLTTDLEFFLKWFEDMRKDERVNTPVDLSKRIAVFKRVIQGYMERYYHYWTTKVDSEASVQNFDNWDEFLKTCSQIKVYDINYSLRTFYAIKDNALRVIPVLKGVFPDTSSELKSIAEKQRLLNDQFDDICAYTLTRFSLLPDEPEKAWQRLNNLSPEKLIVQYFGPYNPDQSKAIPWWNQFLAEGIELLRRNISDTAYNHLRRVGSQLMRFPLCFTYDRSPGIILPQGYVTRQFRFLIGYYRSPQAAAPITGKGKEAIVPLDYPVIRKIIDPVAFSNEQRQTAWKRLRKILVLLGDPVKPLSWTLAIPNRDVREKAPVMPGLKDKIIPAALRYPYIEITQGGTPLMEKISLANVGNKSKVINELNFSASDSDLEINLYRFANSQNPDYTISFPGNWSGINMYLREGVKYDAKAKTYLVPIIFRDKTGYLCSLWLGMNFNKKMPLPSEWPTEKNWIDYFPPETEMISSARLYDFYHLFFESFTGNTAQDLKKVPKAAMQLKGLTPKNNKVMYKLAIQPTQRSLSMGIPAENVFRYMTIQVGDEQPSEKIATSPATNDAGIAIPSGKETIKIHLYEFLNSKKPAVTLTLPGPNAVLKASAQNMAQFNASKGHINIPIRFSYMKRKMVFELNLNPMFGPDF